MSNKFYRKERLEKQFAQIISETLLFRMNDVRLNSQLISVTRVVLSAEMSTATVYVRVLEEEQKNKIIKTLYNGASYFKHAIMQKINMKSYPTLRFFIDEKEKKASDTLDLIARLSDEMGISSAQKINDESDDGQNKNNQQP